MKQLEPITINYTATTTVRKACHCCGYYELEEWDITIDKGWTGLLEHMDMDEIFEMTDDGSRKYKKGDMITLIGDVTIG